MADMKYKDKNRRRWTDSDGSTLEVILKVSGGLYLDTGPDSPGIDSMVEIKPDEIQGLIEFMRRGYQK